MKSYSNTGTKAREIPNTVYVAPQSYAHELRWHWVRHTHDGACDRWSRETFATEFEAVLAAADIARCSRMRLVAPERLRSSLVAHWSQLGRNAFEGGLTLERCTNQYERRGWLEAEEDMELLFDYIISGQAEKEQAHDPMGDAYAVEVA